MKQQSSFALGIESAHVQDEHKDLPGTSPSLQNGGIPIAPVSKSVPSHPANTPQFLENSHHTCASLSVVPVAAQDAISPQQASSNVHEQDSQSRRDQKKTCALPYVLFAIDGTWQEAKEIYKVESASAAFCLSANAEDHPSLTPNIAATSSAALCVMSTTADAQVTHTLLCLLLLSCLLKLLVPVHVEWSTNVEVIEEITHSDRFQLWHYQSRPCLDCVFTPCCSIVIHLYMVIRWNLHEQNFV